MSEPLVNMKFECIDRIKSADGAYVERAVLIHKNDYGEKPRELTLYGSPIVEMLEKGKRYRITVEEISSATEAPSSPREEGTIAYRQWARAHFGVQAPACPYEEGSDDAEKWDAGFREAADVGTRG